MGIFKLPRITTTDRSTLTLGLGELVYDTDLDKVYQGDGATAGGIAVASGTGDVVGPASAVNNRVVFFDGTTGKLIKDSGLTLSGSNTGDQTITLTGDVTGSGTGSFAATIANNAVTLGKMATMATASFLGRNTAGTGNVEVLSVATVSTMLSLSGTNSGDETTSSIKTKLGVASSGVDGYLSGTDWTTFNSKEPAVTKGNLTESTSSVLTITGGSSSVIGSGVTIQVKQSSSTVSGYLSSTDWSTFNSKEPALTKGNLTESTSSVLTITGGSNAIIGSGLTIEVKQATSSVNGYLSSTDWSTFNNKQSALTFSTGLTNTSGTVTANLSVGVSGGQSVIGGSASGNSLTLTSTSNATKGNIIFGSAGLSVYDEVNNRFGINITAPSAALHIVTNISAESFWSDRYVGTTAAGAPGIILRKARGTSSSPTAAQSGDTLGVFGFRGYGSTAFSSGSRAALLAYAAETWTDTAQGTYLAYSTTINGSTTLSEKLRIDNDGNVLIGTTTNGGFKLDVNGTFRSQGDVTIADAKNIILNTTTGTKIGTATTQKIGFWNAAPIIQPTTAISTSITFTANTGTAINSASTFGGYTIIQVIQALKNLGIIA